MRIAVYPGSFDPVTNGHLDIIKRSSKLFDKVIVAVLHNANKTPLFTVEEKMDLLFQVTKDIQNVEIDSFSGLLADYVTKNNISSIVKGLRAVSDFEYELQMALMNRKLNPDVETIFMMTSGEYSYLSSSLVKEVFRFNGCIKGLVPDEVIEAMKKKVRL
ncbi:pantetheine-phosphate adenylyltransferase [Anaerosolibacter carboniphilus]|uniref:Phosphopantetheine adenylyltransferase n=1 Tax=Anaerosolibacter carboniphilus TaxID=1417629 RepID=A0A841L6A1_9FIRM|nr:pantetheine-phosphate adenylyltransferase [Anaerosolibacter carboniphilus]MBB6217825.1 pantetheine-phosphate adenylyltransferase [Anaerosolibacter carboniphilus]